jgi:hypothetical protein
MYGLVRRIWQQQQNIEVSAIVMLLADFSVHTIAVGMVNSACGGVDAVAAAIAAVIAHILC